MKKEDAIMSMMAYYDGEEEKKEEIGLSSITFIIGYY